MTTRYSLANSYPTAPYILKNDEASFYVLCYYDSHIGRYDHSFHTSLAAAKKKAAEEIPSGSPRARWVESKVK